MIIESEEDCKRAEEWIKSLKQEVARFRSKNFSANAEEEIGKEAARVEGLGWDLMMGIMDSGLIDAPERHVMVWSASSAEQIGMMVKELTK